MQRVAEAQVVVEGEIVGRIGRGVLLLLAVQRGDDEAHADRLLERVLGYRVFPGTEGRMNLSLLDVRGELLVVSQFTLAADTKKGMRAGFSKAAAPADGERLYEYFLARARASGLTIGAGRY